MESIRKYVPTSIVDDLKLLASGVKFTYSKEHYVRLGEHENESISDYHFSKWYSWTRHERLSFFKLLPKELLDLTFMANFTKYQADIGYLDKIVQFRDRKQPAGRITAIALNDNQQIIVNDVLMTLDAGDVISFKVTETHAVPKSPKEALWVVTLQV